MRSHSPGLKPSALYATLRFRYDSLLPLLSHVLYGWPEYLVSESCKPPPATLRKKRLWQEFFPVDFAKCSRTPFLQNTSGRLLLSY